MHAALSMRAILHGFSMHALCVIVYVCVYVHVCVCVRLAHTCSALQFSLYHVASSSKAAGSTMSDLLSSTAIGGPVQLLHRAKKS